MTPRPQPNPSGAWLTSGILDGIPAAVIDPLPNLKPKPRPQPQPLNPKASLTPNPLQMTTADLQGASPGPMYVPGASARGSSWRGCCVPGRSAGPACSWPSASCVCQIGRG